MRRIKLVDSIKWHYAFEARDADTGEFVGFLSKDKHIVNYEGIILYHKGEYMTLTEYIWWD